MEVSDPNHRYLRAAIFTSLMKSNGFYFLSRAKRKSESYDPNPTSLCKWTVMGVERDVSKEGTVEESDIWELGPARPLETV